MKPARPNVCEECAGDHLREEPHNVHSVHYQMRFYAMHGRYPTWSDAMQHCDAEMQAHVRESLVAAYKAHNLPVPEDLMEAPPG